jgi:hypothetical protein
LAIAEWRLSIDDWWLELPILQCRLRNADFARIDADHQSPISQSAIDNFQSQIAN